jgi:hypothetical protein
MIDLKTLVTDPYNRKARLSPVLLVLMPVIFVAVLLFPDIEQKSTIFLAIVFTCGLGVWFTQIGRDRGKALEPKLFEMWGGKPSMAMLRHRDPRLDAVTKARYRNFLQSRVEGLQLSSEEEEARSPGTADQGYESATQWLLSNTRRDKEKFNLLFEENMNYGFRRNLWALKPYAMAINGLLSAYLLIQLAGQWHGDWNTFVQTINQEAIMSLALIALHTFGVLATVTIPWVKMAADEYARRLLAACDAID